MLRVKSMKRRLVEQALKAQGCSIVSDDGDHTKWRCPCGKHSANIARHKETSPGVIRSTIKRLACLPEGWLQ